MTIKNTKRKEIAGYIKLCIPAKKATPGPPIGPAFGQKGVSGADFVKQFNEATKKLEEGTPVRVTVTVYTNKTFSFELLGTPVSYYLRKYANIEKGSSEPGRNLVGTIQKSSIKKIAEIKMNEGLSARNTQKSELIIMGSAKSMGLKIIEDESKNEN